MNKEYPGIIESELKNDMYFIEFPNNVTEDFWKDGNGDYKPISSMKIDHIIACIKYANKSLEKLKSRPDTVIKALKPLVKQKIMELETELERKIRHK
jgi:hypothetical protein